MIINEKSMSLINDRKCPWCGNYFYISKVETYSDNCVHILKHDHYFNIMITFNISDDNYYFTIDNFKTAIFCYLKNNKILKIYWFDNYGQQYNLEPFDIFLTSPQKLFEKINAYMIFI